MIDFSTDVAILGAGFGGSLTALLLRRSGLDAALIDRSRHPRFAIGESSTPVADLVLSHIARVYNLPRIAPLAKYGTWIKHYPDILCGLKRGFGYFRHEPGRLFTPDADHSSELLVAASSSDERSDTHWHRADVDWFFAREAVAAGAPLFEETRVALCRTSEGWKLEGECRGEPLRIRAKFLIDASGEAGVVLRHLGIADRASEMKTHSRGIFAHFANVTPWRECMRAHGGDLSDHPFCCDDAAIHQICDDGWMWQLRFRNDVLSAGFAVDSSEAPIDPSVPIEEEWRGLLARSPSIGEQFRSAQIVAPEGGLRRTGRMQRRAAQAVGVDWAALPNTAGFIDPLQSTGIGQTLCGIERLVPILARHWTSPVARLDALRKYEADVFAELHLIDEIVSGCYLARRNFRLFAAFAALYFAAATTYERRRLAAPESGLAFLCAGDAAFGGVVAALREELHTLVRSGPVSRRAAADFEATVARAIAPYNSAGLCDPAAKNMYRFTVLPESP